MIASSGSQESMISFGYTNVYGGEDYLLSSSNIILDWGEGNLDVDPLFCNILENNFSLQDESSCISASDTSGPIGAFNSGCDQHLGIDNIALPNGFSIKQNYPNPFNPNTTIKYSLRESALVSISIFSLSGRKVINLVQDYHGPGEYLVEWNGKDKLGNKVSTGIYIYRSILNDYVDSKKMILAK